jgi:hypothetical protein
MHNLHNNHIGSLENYFHNKTNNSHLHPSICDPDINYTSHNIHDTLPKHNKNIRM